MLVKKNESKKEETPAVTDGNETLDKKNMKIQTKALRRLMGEKIIASAVHKTNPGSKSKKQ